MKVSSIKSQNSSPNFNGLNAAKVLSSAANINSWQQRAALGLTAITFQPAIDLINKDVDEETRKVSANRSFAKGLVGAVTGIVVRGGCMKLVEQGLKNESWADKLAKITAEDATEEAIEKAKDFIKNQGGAKKYASVLGTLAAIIVMLYTNFAIDAPLTNWLTNIMNKKFDNKKELDPTTMPTPQINGGAK